MIDHITNLLCDAPGCMVQFSSDGLPANGDKYVLDAALRHGWTTEEGRLFCPAHSGMQAQILPAEKAVRLLINNPPAIRSAPPFLVGKLKLLLSEFNAKTFTWRNS